MEAIFEGEPEAVRRTIGWCYSDRSGAEVHATSVHQETPSRDLVDFQLTEGVGEATQRVGDAAGQAVGQVGQTTNQAVGQATDQVQETAEQASEEAESQSGVVEDEEPNATHAARQKAERLGVNLSEVEGSGAGGRIKVADVMQAAQG